MFDFDLKHMTTRWIPKPRRQKMSKNENKDLLRTNKDALTWKTVHNELGKTWPGKITKFDICRKRNDHWTRNHEFRTCVFIFIHYHNGAIKFHLYTN